MNEFNLFLAPSTAVLNYIIALNWCAECGLDECL